MAFGSAMTKVNFDAQTDDPKQAFTELATNSDLYNAFRLLMKACAGLDIGTGLKDDLAGNLAVDLATAGALEIATNQLQVKLQAISGLERVAAGLKVDINGMTLDASPDSANDFLMTYDASATALKKVALNQVGGVAADSITQTEIANAAVGQGELKTTTGDMTSVDSTNILTGPGGEYGFWPTIKNSSITVRGFELSPFSGEDANNTTMPSTNIGTTLLQRFVLGVSTGSSQTVTARQRYIQASPPYDLGDGIVAGFIFALIDNATGEPVAMYQAPEPPWALNGPTNIRPDHIDKTGKKFKRVRVAGERLSAVKGSVPLKMSLLNASRRTVQPKPTLVEITNAMKNADMGLIPHPFIGNNMTGKTVVMLDPMSGFMERMMGFQQDGDSPLDEVFGKGFARIGNIKLPRKGPVGVDIVSAKLK